MSESQFPARFLRFTLLIGLCFSLSIPAMSQVIYVDADAHPGGSGLQNWNNAKQTLRDALAMPEAQTHQIWVAEGLYKPTDSTDRTKTFLVPNTARVYGGFIGTEQTFDERAELFSTTVLSGDIDGVAGMSPNDSFHVVTIIDVSDIEFDGFTIQHGYANQPGHFNGGGMLVTASTNQSQGVLVPHLRNCTFRENTALYGGGLSAYFAVLPLSYCNFIKNTAVIEGGGAWFFQRQNTSPVNFPQYSNLGHNLTFTGNTAPRGGGLFIKDVPSYTEFANCKFADNLATIGGGGIWVDGGGYENLKITHSTIAFNKVITQQDLTGNEGAGIFFNTLNNTSVRFHIENTIVWDNLAYSPFSVEKSAVEGPGSISAALAVTYSNVWNPGNLPWSGTGNIFSDPKWENAQTRVLTLKVGSACINSGSDALIKQDILDLDGDGNTQEPIPVDLRRNRPRIGLDVSQFPNRPTQGPTDMGCFERGFEYSGF